MSTFFLEEEPQPDADRGQWMQTYSGNVFYPNDPRAVEVHIIDIAAALSKLCRYGGHCHEFYSVAEHSVMVARHAPAEYALEALLHDASEAYLVDVPRPIKRYLTNYRDIERRLEMVIAKKFGLQYWQAAGWPGIVKELDERILVDETSQLMKEPRMGWNLDGKPLGLRLECWLPQRANQEFLNAFYHYTAMRNERRT